MKSRIWGYWWPPLHLNTASVLGKGKQFIHSTVDAHTIFIEAQIMYEPRKVTNLA